MTKIAILAGGGRLPLMIAESLAARGRAVHIVGIDGEADRAIENFPHTWVNMGQIGRMVTALREGGGEIVIAGSVTRPDLWKIRPDRGFFAHLPKLATLLAGGDDAVLTRVVRFFEQQGMTVHGAHQVAPDLLASPGRMGGVALSDQGHIDARIGFSVRRVLGPLDAGQAVAVADGRVLAIEGAEGTDAMLRRVAAMPGREAGASLRGVLAKGPKPGQELRVDMPAIGPNTIAGILSARLGGVAIEEGAVLVLDRAETLAAADAGGCAVMGLPGDGNASSLPAAMVSPSPRAVQVLGRHAPGARDRKDIERGLAVVERLEPFATGASAVVSRAYVLAIEAGEGVTAMLERVRALRQWGEGRIRQRLGVLVRRLGDTSQAEPAPAAVLDLARAQGLAGVALIGEEAALAPYGDAVRSADDAGLFLVSCAPARG